MSQLNKNQLAKMNGGADGPYFGGPVSEFVDGWILADPIESPGRAAVDVVITVTGVKVGKWAWKGLRKLF